MEGRLELLCSRASLCLSFLLFYRNAKKRNKKKRRKEEEEGKALKKERDKARGVNGALLSTRRPLQAGEKEGKKKPRSTRERAQAGVGEDKAPGDFLPFGFDG